MDRDWQQRRFTAFEEQLISRQAQRLEDEAVAKLYLDLARFERGER